MTPREPTEPFAPARLRPRDHVLRALTIDVVRGVVLVSLALLVAVRVVVPEVDAWKRAELDRAQQELALLRAQLDAIHDIGPMVPPTNDKLFSILAKGSGVVEDTYRTTTAAVAPSAAFATDLPAAERTDAFTQEFLIQNTHASQLLCVRPIAWAALPTTCDTTCSTSGFTCSGAATDGWHLQAGQAMEFREDGTNCVCVMGSGAGTNYQSRRVVR